MELSYGVIPGESEDDNDDNDSKAGDDLPVIIIHMQVEHSSLQLGQGEPWDKYRLVK